MSWLSFMKALDKFIPAKAGFFPKTGKLKNPAPLAGFCFSLVTNFCVKMAP
jgi:hypothetical protein